MPDFSVSFPGRVIAGREKEGRARLRRLVRSLLKTRCLVDAAAGHDAIGAERLRQVGLLARLRRARAGRNGKTCAEPTQHQVAAADGHNVALQRADPRDARSLDLQAREGEGEAQDGFSAVEKHGLCQGTAVRRERRNMDEEDSGRLLLPGRPIERKVIEEVAEIAAGRPRRSGGNAALFEMRGERARRQRTVEPFRPSRQDDVTARQRTRGVGARACAIMGRAFDAESFGALAQAKVNHYMRLELLVDGLHEVRDRLPLGRKNARMQLSVKLRKTPGQRLGKPGRRVDGSAGEGAEPGE